jgi:hypothetical protein
MPAGGLVDLVPALAVMLGANVGTTLIVQVLSFDMSRVSFLFILIGVFMFRRSGVTRTRDLGRVGIGLGLMLIALQHLLSMITPYEDVPSLRILLGAVTTDPLIDIVLAAGLTWAAHSSVAVVLLIMAEQVAQIAASIRESGFTVPVLVDEQGTLIAGHGRVLAAQQLGITDVPTMVARGWTAQIQAYRLTDNQLALNAGWDRSVLLGERQLPPMGARGCAHNARARQSGRRIRSSVGRSQNSSPTPVSIYGL